MRSKTQRSLRIESLENRQLLSIVSVVAKNPRRSEEPVGGQTDPGQFVVVRDTVTASPLMVSVKITGTAMWSGDYSPLSGFSYDGTGYVGSVTIPADEASATLTITPVNDPMKESTETVTATVLGGGGYSVGSPSSDSVTIADNENWQVKVEANDPIAGERASAPLDPGQFTITRVGSGDLSSALWVSFTLGGTAMYGGDYSSTPGASGSPPTGSVTIAAGQTTATVSINVNNDMMPESLDTVTLTLTSGNYSIAAPAAATVSITDNDGSSSWLAKIEAVQGTAWSLLPTRAPARRAGSK